MRVPDGWETKKLGKLAKTVTSGSRDWAQYYAESGSKFIRMTNLRRDGIQLKLDDLKYVNVINDSADGKRTALQNGDILISITAELGKIGWIPDDFGEAFINQHTALIRINQEKANSKFIAYLLSSKRMNQIINTLNDAGAKAGLNLPTIKEFKIHLPPLPEQQKIAQIFSTWDKAIEKLEALIAAKQKCKKALMQQLLTGKVRFLGFENGGFSIRKGFAKSKLGKLPNDWLLEPIKKYYWYQEGPGVRKHQFTRNGVKLLNGTNIQNSKINLSNTLTYISEQEAYGVYAHFQAEDGDLVIACSGISVDRFDEKIAFLDKSHLPLCMNTSTMRFRKLDDQKASIEYFKPKSCKPTHELIK